MSCRIHYDFIAQTRDLTDGTPACVVREAVTRQAPANDILRPNAEADGVLARHLMVLASARAATLAC